MIKNLTEQEIVEGLIARDETITKDFFFVKCRPLFIRIINHVFSYEVDYDEFVNELYVYLMIDDAAKLRGFQYRSSLYQWLKVIAIRYFVKKRDKMIEDKSSEAPYNECVNASNEIDSSLVDLKHLFELMPNQRYVYIIKRLVIDGIEPGDLALELNITVANLYNIKRRAMVQLTRIALKDVEEYGKK